MGELTYETSASTVWITWSSAATGDETWLTWAGDNDCTSATTVATSATIWVKWIGISDCTSATLTVGACEPYVDHRTPEQIAADDARFQREREQIQQRADERAAVRRAAIDRARALLLSMLSVKQREQYQRDRFFEVIGQHSKRRYRIRQGTHGNVRLLDESGREVTSYCAQPVNVPDEDAMLAQKLMLEHDEQKYVQVANATRLAG